VTVNGNKQWIFNTVGALQVPNTGAILASPNSSATLGNSTGTVKFFADDDGAYVQTSNGANTFLSVFQPDGDFAVAGNIIFPGGSQLGEIAGNTTLGIAAETNHDILLETSNSLAGASWTFDTAGNTILPGQGVIKYANGTLYGSNFTGNITFSGTTISSNLNQDIEIDAPDNANIKITGNSRTWNFLANGALTYPDGTLMFNDSDAFHIASGNFILSMGANANVASTWEFDRTGNFTLPQGGSIYSLSTTPSGSPGNTIILQPAGKGVTTNQQLLVYPTAGDGDHIHMTSGNLYQTELFLGSDNLYVKLANTGNVVINSNDDNGSYGQWTFGTNSALTVPGDIRAQEGNDLNVRVYNPSGQGGVSYVVENYQVDIDARTTQFIVSPVDVTITTDDNNGGYQWTFDNGGNLTFPDTTVQTTAYTGVAEPGFTLQAGSFAAVAGGRYGVDTYSADGPVTATLPTTPNNGDAVYFADAGGYTENGALTIDAGTNSIMDGGSTLVVSTSNQCVGLFWNGRTWRTYNAV
jgi:hypothetical protein